MRTTTQVFGRALLLDGQDLVAVHEVDRGRSSNGEAMREKTFAPIAMRSTRSPSTSQLLPKVQKRIGEIVQKVPLPTSPVRNAVCAATTATATTTAARTTTTHRLAPPTADVIEFETPLFRTV